jgi:hypothetical protein
LAFSDSVQLFSPCSVRISLSFGLDLALSAVSCPNMPLIRTLFRFFLRVLSEYATHSDSIWLYLPCPVRICLSFGLNSAFSSVFCPNKPLIRTQFGFICRVQSEYATHSDSVPLFPPCSVRICLSFGLNSAFSSVSCPNMPFIRTQFRFFLRVLSE